MRRVYPARRAALHGEGGAPMSGMEISASPRDGGHAPVLLDRVLEVLAPREGETVIDCTAGLGGHASVLARAVGPRGVVVLNDADAANLPRAAGRVRAAIGGAGGAQVLEWAGSFVDVPRRASAEGVSADVVLADLGFASVHVDDGERGFSFKRDGPLDMRYDRGAGASAATLVNTMGEEELASILFEYGEERQARRIARKVVAERDAAPIETTGRLAEIVRGVVGRGGGGRIDPATRTFQALRIAVNDELGALASLLESVVRSASLGAMPGHRGGGWLAPGARVGVIAFHSLEDRLVKQSFGELVRRGLGEALTRRPAVASEEERAGNPRARSAKLRAVRILVSAG